MADGIKAEMYKIANRLKARMGARYKDQEEGFLAPDVIEEADKLITQLCEICPDVIAKHLENLSALWDKMRDMPNSAERTETAEKIFTLSHEIKDMGSMCGYGLIAYFAESLRDYIDRTDLNLKAQVVIIQAHLDAMQMCHRKGFRTDAGPEAEELKKMVKMAIDKYH